MKQATNTQPQSGTPIFATQVVSDKTESNAQLAISGDLGLIVLGTILLGISGYLFVVKLCKRLTSCGNN